MPQSETNLVLPLPIFQTQPAPSLPVRVPTFFPYTSASPTITNDVVITTIAYTLGATSTCTSTTPFPVTYSSSVSYY